MEVELRYVKVRVGQIFKLNNQASARYSLEGYYYVKDISYLGVGSVVLSRMDFGSTEICFSFDEFNTQVFKGNIIEKSQDNINPWVDYASRQSFIQEVYSIIGTAKRGKSRLYDFKKEKENKDMFEAKKVDKIYVNEKKGTVTVVLKDGSKGTSKCSAEDKFDEHIGIQLAFTIANSESKVKLHRELDKAMKKIVRQ